MQLRRSLAPEGLALAKFSLYPLIIFNLLGEFKGGGFMDSGPYPDYMRNYTTIHTRQSHLDSRHQTPSRKGGN